MKKGNQGFTIIEVVIVILIVGILVSLSSVQLLRTQLVARDKERVDDVTAIANHLENIYKTGQPAGASIPPGDPLVTSSTPMGYPSTALVSLPNDDQTKAILGSLNPEALKSPLKKTMSLTAASDNTDLSGNGVSPTSSNDNYIFQPLKDDGTLCTIANSSNLNDPNPQRVIAPRLSDECVAFNIYYVSESKEEYLVKKSRFSEANGL